MEFSIIIPIYNVEQYLGECLESLQKQDYTDFEVICVNDGSTDASRQILTKWETHFPQIRVIDRENGGLSTARNTGLAASKGDYILFVDSDDWIEPNTLQTLQNNINGEDILCFACKRTDNKSIDQLIPEQSNGWDYYNRHALKHWETPFVCVVQRCYRREFLLDNGLLFHDGILHEDNEFTPRVCFKAKNVKVIPDVLYNYRVRPGSIMTTRGLRSKESLITIGNELSAYFSRQQDINKTIVYQALTQCYQMAFINNTCEEDDHLHPLIDWKAYRRVSKTKIRHRVNFILIMISPYLFRKFNQV